MPLYCILDPCGKRVKRQARLLLFRRMIGEQTFSAAFTLGINDDHTSFRPFFTALFRRVLGVIIAPAQDRRKAEIDHITSLRKLFLKNIDIRLRIDLHGGRRSTVMQHLVKRMAVVRTVVHIFTCIHRVPHSNNAHTHIFIKIRVKITSRVGYQCIFRHL